MRDQRRRSGWRAAPGLVRLGACLALVATMACNVRGSDGGSVVPGEGESPGEGPGPQGDQESNESIDDLKARLDRLRIQHAEMSTSSDGSFGVCEDLCSLASNICTVKEKLCEIADRHPGEEAYQGLCRKAELECGEAEDSCVDCVEARERSGADEASGQ